MRLRKNGLATIAAAGAIVIGSGASDAWVGRKGAEPQVVTAGKAPRMHRTVAWTAPARAATPRLAMPGWKIVWDRDTDTPTQLMGPNQIASGTVADGSIAESVARAWLSSHLELLAPGATMDNFTLITNQLDGDIRTVAFAQHVNGIKVMGASIGFSFKNDHLSLISSTALPNVKVDIPTARLPVSAIHAAATAWLAGAGKTVAPRAVATLAGDRTIIPVIRPKTHAGVSVDYRVAETVSVESTTAQPGRWDVYVDARDATAFARKSTLLYSSGTVEFDVPAHDPSHLPRATVPAPNMTATVNGAAATTDANGSVTFTGASATIVPNIIGTFVAVAPQAGTAVTDTLTLASGGSITWSEASDPDTDAQLDAYIYASQANAFAKANYNPPEQPQQWLNGQLPVTVDENDTCNAFWDGNGLNFFQLGGGCENTGRISDVVYHEFGHGLHQNSIIAGVGQFDASLSEGVADTNAMTITKDHGVGIGFELATPDAYLRDEKPAVPKVWPTDADGEPHDEGEIFGEAMVDTRDNLIAKLGDGPGRVQAIKIYYSDVQRAPDIPDTFGPALLGDDDDGDLTNGTPNQCEIQAAFGRHGLADPDASLGLTSPTQNNFTISFGTNPAQSQCPTASIQSAVVSWHARSASNPADQQVTMTAAGSNYSGVIPTQPDGTTVLFNVQITLSDSTVINFPDNKADPYYQFFVGTVTPIYCQDWESGIQDWTHSGTRDQWEVGAPMGLGGDPTEAHGGSNVAGIDLGLGSGEDGTYKSNSNQKLESAMIDLKGNTQVHLQYYRWLGVEDGFYDQATITANGTAVWTNFASASDPETAEVNHVDKEWIFQDVDVSAQAASGKIQLDYTLVSDPGLELSGWNIDDVCLVSVQIGSNNPTCGNGTVDPGEQCDDGPANGSDGDPCSATCTDVTSGGGGNGGGCCSVGGSPAGSMLLGGAVLGLVLRRRRRAAA